MSGHNANIANHPHQLSLRTSASADSAEGSADGSYSAIAFVGGWGSSMYQYAYNDPDSNAPNPPWGLDRIDQRLASVHEPAAIDTAGSNHTGGANFLLADGSVRSGSTEAGEWPWQLSTHRRSASGDVDSDGVDDLIVGAGPAGGHVKVFDGRSADDVLASSSQHSAATGTAGGGGGAGKVSWSDLGVMTKAADDDQSFRDLVIPGDGGGGLGDYALIADFNAGNASAASGVNAMMGDGSVRFIRDSIPPAPGGGGDDVLIGGLTGYDPDVQAAANNLHQLGLAVHNCHDSIF